MQTLIRQRASEKNIVRGTKKYQKRYVFSGKIICGECGNTFKRRTHGSYIAWCCNTHLEDTSKCSMLFVRDDAIKLVFVTMMNKLIFANKQILKPYVESLINSSTDTSAQQIQKLEILIAQCNEKRETLTRLMAQGIIDRILFTKEINALSAKSNQYRREMEKLNSTLTDDSEKLLEAKALLNFASKSTMLLTWQINNLTTSKKYDIISI